MSDLKQKEIAQRAGLATPNIISMWKNYDSKIPVRRIPALAKTLDKNPNEFLEIALREYQPEIWEVISETFDL